jgi:hypothetical protein
MAFGYYVEGQDGKKCLVLDNGPFSTTVRSCSIRFFSEKTLDTLTSKPINHDGS